MKELLARLDLKPVNPGAWSGEHGWSNDSRGPLIDSVNPATNEVIAQVRCATAGDYEQLMQSAVQVAKEWRMVPAPRRGEVVRLVGEELRANKDALGSLVTLENGKIKAEGDGEVQEMIDIADFAVGQSRMLYGLAMHSERPQHRMFEQWHPLGVVGIISAFNFPVAVWSWNAFLAAICGNVSVWKPSPKTPLCAVAVQEICNRVRQARMVSRPSSSSSSTRAPSWRRSSSMIPAWHWCPSPGRPPWAEKWASASRRGSARACSSSAATTPSSSMSPPTSTSRCPRSYSAPSARRVSAAPARAACSCTKRGARSSRSGC